MNPENVLGDIVKTVTDAIGTVVNVLPPEVATAVNGTVGKILDPTDSAINIGDPQPPGTPPIPVQPGTPELDATQQTLESLAAVLENVVSLAGFLIPDQYKGYIKNLVAALRTVESWL